MVMTTGKRVKFGSALSAGLSSQCDDALLYAAIFRWTGRLRAPGFTPSFYGETSSLSKFLILPPLRPAQRSGLREVFSSLPTPPSLSHSCFCLLEPTSHPSSKHHNMKTSACASIAVAASLLVAHVAAHGQMLEPKFRPITAAYRRDCLWGLKGAGDDELQWAPLENLSKRGQADQPPAPTFDVMNGCRGLVYDAANPVTELTAGVEFPIKYFIQAPHPGYLELYIVKPKTDASGKVTHEQVAKLKRVENFATAGGNFETTATIPASVTGCEKAGACALQFYWHSDVANQTYPTCADIIIKGSGAASSGGSTATTSAPAASTTTKKPTSVPATSAPSTLAPSPTKKKCTAKTRKLKQIRKKDDKHI